MSVIDWDDIHNGGVSELGKECQGWIRIMPGTTASNPTT